MNATAEKISDRSRSVLFGFLVSCLFSDEAEDKCPLALLRSFLSIEEKYEYVMGLSEEEVADYLKQHAECFEKRMSTSAQLR